MGYHIMVFRAETKAKHQSINDDLFFENKNNLYPFSPEQLEELTSYLNYDFNCVKEDATGKSYVNKKSESITALLTNSGIYFKCGWDTDDIFEAGMLASDLNDGTSYAKFDPQNNGWEEL